MTNVELFEDFKRDFRRLAKKFRMLTSELHDLTSSLEKAPKQGKDLGGSFYKIRLASESKGKGKRGGFRIITYFVEKTEQGETLYLVTIYDKSEINSIDKKNLLKIVNAELE